jgi:hypothetical protein
MRDYNVHVCYLKPFILDLQWLYFGNVCSVSRDSTERHVTLVTSERDSVPSKPTPQLPLLPLPTPELMSIGGLWSSASVCGTYVTSCGLWSSASAVGTDKTISTVVRRPRSRLIYDNLRPREGWRLKRKFNVLNLSSSWSGRSFSYGGNVTILCVRSTFLLVSYIIDLV